ncbi:hypothetical protein Pst134EA_019466 [Puccinia striiformis f. sp. tritici]|uniref:hypothetical protein n=1 Tax=Puccinia striiformis f. sp. tritici TaxID=168172 RepID=UPI00200840C6|nr:hypothetical protein Pst134EA_019466 [Puccinia striiformis f. sp. tritici]KAH9459313.1 hypothetical protein Pst134EA_019466 [Puccinia striiformis f. sp. tritici]
MSAFNSSVAGPAPSRPSGEPRPLKAIICLPLAYGASARSRESTTAGPLRATPPLSQLRGIHFVPDANQDPDLDQASSTNPSRPQSAESAPSSGAAPLGNIINSASDVNPSFAGSWSEPRDDDCGSSPSTLSAFEDSSIASDDTSSAIGALLPSVCPVTGVIQLSAQACQAAYPPIDLESPYAPAQKPNQSTTTSVGTFNVRMGLRPPSLYRPRRQPRSSTYNHIKRLSISSPGSSPSSTVDIHLEKTGSSINACPSSPCEVRNASSLGLLGLRRSRDDAQATARTQLLRGRQIYAPAAISGPFQFNGSERLLMPSARLFAGSGPAKSYILRHSPSETSFEARPFSVRTESFYEILDTSAIPCDSTFEPDDDLSWHNHYRYRHL